MKIAPWYANTSIDWPAGRLQTLHRLARGGPDGRRAALEELSPHLESDDRVLDIWGQAMELDSRAREAALKVVEVVPISGISIARVCILIRACNASGSEALGKIRSRSMLRGYSISERISAHESDGFIGDWLSVAGPYIQNPISYDGLGGDPFPTRSLVEAYGCLERGSLADAHSKLKEYLSVNPDDAKARFLKARILAETDPVSAIDELGHPETPLSLKQELLAHLYHQLGDVGTAIRIGEDAFAREPWRASLLRLLLNCYSHPHKVIARLRATHQFIRASSRFFDCRFTTQ